MIPASGPVAAPSTDVAANGRRAAVFVWGVWLAASVAVVAYTARFASDLPFWDEDQYVEVLTGERALSVSWFLERHVDHLIPVPKVIYLAAMAAFGDFRAPALAGAAMLVIATATVIVAARRFRGRTSPVDALIPLVTLHWGQAGNLLFGAQVQVMSSVALHAVTFALMLGSSGPPGALATAGLGACLLALPLCGGQGLALVPALALWPLFAAWRTEGAARVRLALAGAIPLVASLAMIAAHRPAFATTSDPLRVAATSLQFAGMAAGPAGGFGWPGTAIAESAPPLVAIGVAVLGVATAGVLVRAIRASSERLRAGALLLQLAAMATLALSIGVGRGAADEIAGVQNRYVTFALPLLWIAVIAWDRFASGVPRRAMLATFAAGALGFFAFDVHAGLVHGRARSSQAADAYEALRGGESIDSVAARFTPFLHPDRAVLVRELEGLRSARLGPFREEAAR